MRFEIELKEQLSEDDLVHEGMGALGVGDVHFLCTRGELVAPHVLALGAEGGIGDIAAHIAHGDEFCAILRDGHGNIQRCLGAEIGGGDICITDAAGICCQSICRDADAEECELDFLRSVACIGDAK